ncbi:MAG: hypothetical protein ABIF01_04345 [Candidatus Micrarchaeota archaeon]
MELDKNQRTLGWVILLLAIAVAVSVVPQYLNQNIPEVCTIDGNCQHEKALENLITMVPVFLFAGIALGALSFYFLYERKKPETIVVDNKKNVIDIVDVLDKDESKVLKKIISEKGRVLQAEISRLEGIGKVKSHRIIERLEKRGIIEIEGAGKTNIVKLAEKYRKLFFE